MKIKTDDAFFELLRYIMGYFTFVKISEKLIEILILKIVFMTY